MNSNETVQSGTDEGTVVVNDSPVYIPPCEHAESSRVVVGSGFDTADDGTVTTYDMSRCDTCGHEAVTNTTGSTT